MKAHELIEGSTYEPHELKVLCEAFDEAWASISDNFGDDPQTVDSARQWLAKIMLNIPPDEMGTVEQVKSSSIQLMALAYRSRTNGTAALK